MLWKNKMISMKKKLRGEGKKKKKKQNMKNIKDPLFYLPKLEDNTWEENRRSYYQPKRMKVPGTF